MPLAELFESWELFREPVLAGTLAGGLLGAMGVYVVLRRVVFLAAALPQCASFGVTLSFWCSLHLGLAVAPEVGALLLSLAVASLVARDGQGRARRDAILGFAFVAGAAGTLIVGTRIVAEMHDVQNLLFGSAVAVLPEDFRLIVWTTVLFGALHLWCHRGFLVSSLDPDGARVRGMPVRTLGMVLLASLAIALAVTTHALGALPSFAFSVLPAVAALRLVANPQRALALAAALGAASGFLGYLAAFAYEFPVGASQAAVAAAWVPLCWAIASIRR